jgi:hypothetical protein
MQPVKVTINHLERVLGLPPPSCPINPGKQGKPGKPKGTNGKPKDTKPIAKHWFLAEVINARCAMAGQLLGPAVASETGLNVVEQLQQHPAPCLTLVAAVCLYFGMITILTIPWYNPKGLPEQLEMGLGQMAMFLFLLAFIEAIF